MSFKSGPFTAGPFHDRLIGISAHRYLREDAAV
jgi:hypothetical protein